MILFRMDQIKKILIIKQVASNVSYPGSIFAGLPILFDQLNKTKNTFGCRSFQIMS